MITLNPIRHHGCKMAIASLMALAFASCSHDAAEQEPENLRPIEMSVYTYQYTKANSSATRGGAAGSIASATDLATKGFGVFALQTAEADYAENQFIPDLMYNEKVTGTVNGSTIAWNYNPMKFWPQGKVSFFAYAPYAPKQSTDGNGIVSMTTNTDKKAPTVNFKLTNLNTAVDLLYATDEEDHPLTNLAFKQPVKFFFHHALAKIGGALQSNETAGGMSVVLDVDKDGNITGGTKAADCKVTIERIELQQVNNATDAAGTTLHNKIYTGGTLNLWTGAFALDRTQSVAASSATLRQVVAASGYVGSDTQNGVIATTLQEPSGENPAWNDIPAGVNTTASNVFLTETNPFFLLPDASYYPVFDVTIVYHVRTKDAGLEHGYSDIRQMLKRRFTLAQHPESGKRYALTLRLGVTRVKLDGDIEEDKHSTANVTMIWDATKRVWIKGPNIVEDDPDSSDL